MKRSILSVVAVFGVLLLVTACASKDKGPAASEAAQKAQGAPRPAAGQQAADPALRHLDKLVGTWSLRGHLVGSEKENIVGTTSFRWLDGGYFMVQDVELNFAGTTKIKSLELIGYDPESKALTSSLYSNQSPVPIGRRWDVQGSTISITVSQGSLNATFTGTISEDGKSFSGSWRPNPGADEKANVPYDIGASRAG